MLASIFYQGDPARNNKFWENIGSNERYTSTPYDGAADSRQIKQINKQINTNHKKSHDSHVSICIITFVNLKQVENESLQ